MVLRRRNGFIIVTLALSTAAWAAPPRLTATAPLGVRRGKAMDVEFRGSGLGGHPRLLAPFAFRLEESAGGSADAARWKVRLAVDAGTAVGVYPVRIVSDEGVSNPLLLAVGQVPQVAEVEPNDTFEHARSIPTPSVIEGECAGNDEDFFRFHGRKGQRIVVDAACSRIGSGVDPQIRLTTGDGRLVASADDTPGLVTDAYLTAVLPEDGDYVLEVGDSRFEGTGRAVYRLLVGAVPFAGEVSPMAVPRGQNTALELRGGTLSGDRLFALRTPSDPRLATFWPAIPARLLGDPAWADSELDVELPTPVLLGDAVTVAEPIDPAEELPPLVPPVSILGRLSSADERDEFTIKAPPGSRHEVRIEAWGLGSALDGQLRVLGKDRRLLGEADDGKGAPRRRGGGGGRARGPVSTDPAYDLTMPAGQDEVRLVVKDLADRGGVGFTYRLVVQPIEAAFQLALDVDAVAIPRGGTALIPVTAARNGYTGPIELDVRGLPAGGGVTAIPGTVPASQTVGMVGLKADANCTFGAGDVQIVGRGRDGRAVAASRTIVFAQQTISTPGFGMAGTIPSYARPFNSLAAAVVRPGPIVLEPEAPRVVLRQGSTIEVHLKIARTTAEKAKYPLDAPSPPTGLTVAKSEIGESGTRATMKVTAKADAPLGPTTVALVAHAPSQGDGEASSRPAVAAVVIAVDVVRPAGSK